MTLDEYTAAARPLNPDYTDAQIAEQYHAEFPPSPSDVKSMPTLEEYTKAAKPLNPDYSDADIAEHWQSEFGAAGASKEDPGFLGTLKEGAKQTGRSVLAFGDTLAGDDKRVVESAKAAEGAPRDHALSELLSDIAARKEALGKDASWFDAGAEVGKSFLAHPKGSALLLTEQLPNSAAVLGTAATGAAIGSAFGPAGTIAGGIAGLFLGNIAIETGSKALEAAREDGFTAEERDRVLKEGAVKGSVIGAVDTATFGLTRWMTGTVARAMERAATATLAKEGIDVTDKAAVMAAKNNPVIAGKVESAVKLARDASTTLGQRLARTSGEAGLETVGEGVGEYLGEMAATGEGDKVEAIVEAFSGFGQSSAEIALAALMGKNAQEKPTALSAVADLLYAPDVDTAIQKSYEATGSVANQNASNEGVPVSTDELDAFIASQKDQTDIDVGRAVIDRESTTVEQERAADKEELLAILADTPEEVMGETTLTSDERGNAFFNGSPVDIVHPTELPDSTGPTEGMSKEKHEVFTSIASLFGLRVSVFKSAEFLPDGVVRANDASRTVFIATNTQSAGLFSTFIHEVFHKLEGTEFHSAVGMAVWENLTSEAKQLAIDRHGDLSHDALISEMVSDIAGTELENPELWQKVYQNLQEKAGEERAKAEMLSFIDEIKAVINKVKTLIASRPWSTGFGANKKTYAEQYVKNFEKIHDALAAGVANAIYQTKTGIPGQGKIALAKRSSKASRAIVHPDTVKAFTELAKAQRGKPESAMFDVQEATGGGVLSPVVENVGDLIHRMTEQSGAGSPQTATLMSKLDRSISALKNPKKFEKEHNENLRNNARAAKRPVAELRKAVDKALAKYAAEHKKLPVYNESQHLAREASVAVGEKRFPDAVKHLKALKKIVESPDYEKQNFAHEKDGFKPESKPESQPESKKVDNKSEKVDNKSEKVDNKTDAFTNREQAKIVNKEEYDYASTQINLPAPLAKRVLEIGKQIETGDLAEKGLEAEPHITVKYGLHSEDPKTVSTLLASDRGVTASIGDIGMFATKDGDVLILKVVSPDLVKLNEKISTLPNTTEFTDYKPHITIAYVKTGLGKGYVRTLENPLEGQSISVNEIQFSNKKGEFTRIPLKGETGPAVVNIGLNVNDGSTITAEQAIAELTKQGVKVTDSETRQSDSEPTLIATLDRALTPEEANAVSANLKQDAIAQKIGEVGELYGPSAEKWKPFDDQFFLSPDKERVRFSKKNPMIGMSKSELPTNAKVPLVQWDKDALRANAEQIKEEWSGVKGWGKGQPTVYQSYVPIDEMPRARTPEIEGLYDWSEYKKSGVFPPITIVIHRNGIAQKLDDGNHRARFWTEKGFTHFPAWIVDFRKVQVPTTRFSKKIWFSAMGNMLAEKMPANASVQQVQNLLKGAKEDEVKWTGILDYVNRQEGMVNKHNLLKWLEANDVEIKEVTKTATDDTHTPDMDIAEFNAHWNSDGTHRDFPGLRIESTGEEYVIRQPDGQLVAFEEEDQSDPRIFSSFNEASEAAYEQFVADPARSEADSGGRTRFEGWKLPGGEDYTELLLTLDTDRDRYAREMMAKQKDGALSEEEYQTWRKSAMKPRTTEDFTWTHFEEPNILAHVRFDTRKAGTGESVLFLEEVQSDWHEQGREKGYKPDDPMEQVPFDAVPQAPFSKTWPELVMKRMLRYASEHNFDRLAWTTGAQQNERYGLSKHVQELYVRADKEEGEEGTYYIGGKDKSGVPIQQKGNLTPKDLADHIGKELAEKAIHDLDNTTQDTVRYSGLSLEIGGSGMKYFYDQMLPRFMEKYLKRFGTKVDALELSDKKSESLEIIDPPIPPHAVTKVEAARLIANDQVVHRMFVDAAGRHVYSRVLSVRVVDKFYRFDRIEGIIVHSIALTDDMKSSVINKGQPKFSRRNAVPTYAIQKPGKLDYYIRLLQDKNIDVKRVVEAIEKAGGSVPEQLNPVLAEEMFQKRDEQRAKDFTNDELRPLVSLMKLNKVTVKQLDEYLHARHVIDDNLNARLQAINPDLAKSPVWDKLSGITDAEARKILSAANKPVMDVLTQHVDDMVDVTRTLMVDYGLEKQSTIDKWKQEYKYYVPLRREGFDGEGNETGMGKSVRGSTVKQRGGSGLAVENILANIAQARDQIVTRGEKNRVSVAMAALMMLHPNPAIATLDKPATITYVNPATGLTSTVPGNLANYEVPTIRRFNPTTGRMQNYPDPTYKGRDNVVSFRIKGEDYAIVFNENNELAMEVAKALKNLGTPQLNGIMKAVAPYTRYLAAVNTQYNPIFGLVNFVRDAQFAMLTLSSTPLSGKQATVLKNALGSLAGIYQDARAVRKGGQANSQTAQLWRRFEHVGGPTGYRDLFFSASERAEEIERMMDPSSWKGTYNPQKFGKRMEETHLFKWLSDYNLMMENSIRLGVFKTAVDNGTSDLLAASYAKNITVNFNKKGQIGAQMGSLYAFFNANVQGTARIAETLFERTPAGFKISSVGKKIIVGGLLVGVLQTVALALAGFDDDDPPEFVKQKNLVIPVPGTEKGYVMIPMPLGFNLLPNVGRLASEVVLAYAKGKPAHPFEKGAALLSALFGTLSPLGGTGGVQEFAPTVGDPFVAITTNRDWTGKTIAKEDHSALDPSPGHTRAHNTATAWAKALSYAINWSTGGTDYVPGALSPSPDTIDYLVEQATGGVGRELSKASQVVQSTVTGEELPTHKIPLVGRFVGSATGSSSVRNKFFENVKASNLAYREFEGRALHHETFSEYVQRHPEARFAKAAKQVQDDVAILNKQKAILLKGGASREAIQAQEERVTGLMNRFNLLIERAQEQAP